MERKAWWAAGTLGALVFAGLVTAGIAVSSRAGDDTDKDERVKRTRVKVISRGERAAFLGVRTSKDTDGEQGGARVDEVVDDSPARRAGIEEGDVIVSFDGDAVRSPMALTERIHKASPKDEVEVEVLRDGKRKKLDVTLGERSHTIIVPGDGETIEVPLPDTDALQEHLKGLDHLWGNGKNTWVFRMGNRPKLGVQLVETTPELRDHLGGGRSRGVLVGKVISGTPAEKAGIKVGDLIVSVDGTDVSDAGELIEALEDKDGKRLQIEVVRDRRSVRIEVALPDEDEDEVSGPRAVRGQARQELLAARDAQRVQIEAMRLARQQARASVDAARQAQMEAARAIREQLRRERIRSRELGVI